MFRIDRMSLKLPSTHRQHAEEIAQRVANGIAIFEVSRSRTIPYLQIPPISVTQNASRDEVVQTIVGAIRTTLGNKL